MSAEFKSGEEGPPVMYKIPLENHRQTQARTVFLLSGEELRSGPGTLWSHRRGRRSEVGLESKFSEAQKGQAEHGEEHAL